MTPYTPPSTNLTAFNCSICGAFAQQTWFPAAEYRNGQARLIQNYYVVHCGHCQKYSVWVSGKMVYPFTGTAPLPNPDMPDDVRQDYEEARNISMISPRGAAALLRLAIQKLCKHLGQSGENINADIANLVKDGLSVKLQQALDSVRVVGNNAVHPGQIDLKDDIEIANKLFVFVNIICDNQISQVKQIGEFYDVTIPDNLKQAIEKRDSK
jgi:hypothetical protein